MIYYVDVPATAATAVDTFHLMGDSRRWRLLEELSAGDRRVGELSRATGDPQNLVSYHLRLLRDAGLVDARRSTHDGRDTYYRADLDRCANVLCEAGATLSPSLHLTVVPVIPRRGRRPYRVLFLCTGNSARSQMAAALLTHRSHGGIRADSAGSHPKELHPAAVRVMTEHGIDISANTTKHLDRFARTRFDAVITVCDKVREVCPEFPGGPVAIHWSIPDPNSADPDEGDSPFRATADELEVRVRHLMTRIATERQGAAS